MSNPNGNPAWQKGGASPNPSGRPKGAGALAEAARELAGGDGRVMLEVLAEIALDTAAKHSDRITAADTILSRGWGKALQPAELEIIQQQASTPVETANYDALSLDELRQLEKLHMKVLGMDAPAVLSDGKRS